MSLFEIEVRGVLSEERYEKVRAKLTTEGEYVETKNRLLIDYSYHLPDGGIKGRTRDIRLRTTNGVAEIVVKVGRWGGRDQRQEFAIKCPDEDFNKLVQIFAILGYKRGVVCVRNSEVFTYKGVEVALVEVPGHSRYFEVELMIDDEDNAAVAHRELEEICRELGLHPFSEKDFMNYVEKLNLEANDEFNFNSDWFPGYFKSKYKIETFPLPKKGKKVSRA